MSNLLEEISRVSLYKDSKSVQINNLKVNELGGTEVMDVGIAEITGSFPSKNTWKKVDKVTMFFLVIKGKAILYFENEPETPHEISEKDAVFFIPKIGYRLEVVSDSLEIFMPCNPPYLLNQHS
jgi:hypothetical protein